MLSVDEFGDDRPKRALRLINLLCNEHLKPFDFSIALRIPRAMTDARLATVIVDVDVSILHIVNILFLFDNIMTYIIATLDRYHIMRFALINYIERQIQDLDEKILEIKLQLRDLLG